MKRRKFLKNTRGVSSIYDAVLFIVMVSLSGVVLLPAIQSDIAIDASIEKHRTSSNLSDVTVTLIHDVTDTTLGTYTYSSIEQLA